MLITQGKGGFFSPHSVLESWGLDEVERKREEEDHSFHKFKDLGRQVPLVDLNSCLLTLQHFWKPMSTQAPWLKLLYKQVQLSNPPSQRTLCENRLKRNLKAQNCLLRDA